MNHPSKCSQKLDLRKRMEGPKGKSSGSLKADDRNFQWIWMLAGLDMSDCAAGSHGNLVPGTVED